eukprot:GFUD01030377.1.p1 GENE.GFUD01030377.1~~GFUD01030377.1.p1  ORF type:complete len:169 (-),score=57.36 GFUD01030377.1:42-548(-)
MTVPRLGSVLLCKRIFGSRLEASRGQHQPSGQKSGLATSSKLMDMFFTKQHEWVLVEGTKGTIGVSAYAADALGDVVYAQLPDPGDSVEVGEECGALESVKAASEIYSPVSGTVAEKNEKVEDGPALINQSPQVEGWLFRVDLADPGQVSELMNTADYEKYLKECEEH